MAFVIADRVRETSVTTGTGSIALSGAVTGYQTFDAVLNTADTTFYTIADQGGANWEVGIGTFTSPSTLARTTILSSSNGGSIVTFGAGTKDVFISLPASKTNVEDQPNLIEVNSASDALRITQTGSGNALVVEDNTNPDSSPFVVDSSGNVGIGTSSPVVKLNVVVLDSVVSALFSGETKGVRFYSNSFGGIVEGVDNTGVLSYQPLTLGGSLVTFTTSASERMRVDSSGNLLVGTTTPVSKVTVDGDVSGTFFINPTTVSVNYTIPSNYNAMTAGPITVNSGITVTVPSGSTWVVV